MSEKNLNHEIKDDELANVSGGCGGSGGGNKDNTPDTPKIPDSLFEVGDMVTYKAAPEVTGAGKVLAKKHNGSIWKYDLELNGQTLKDIPEDILKKC